VGKLVGDDALELVAVELFERAAGDGDDGVGGGEPGGESVDGPFVVQDVDGGNGRAGGDGHFLDDVEEAAFLEVRCIRIDETGADTFGDGASAGGKLAPFQERGEADAGEGDGGDGEEEGE